jgi:hypothetical protein
MSRLSLTLITAFVILGAYCIDHSLASRTGITGQSKIGCGQSCHGFSASSNTKVTIWSDSSQLTIGQTYVFHITVANSLATQVAGGCDISCDASAKLALNGSGTGLKLSGSELTHSTPKAKVGDSITWSFKFTPSKAGSIKIYAAGNAVNGNGREESGDQWNTTVYTVAAVAATPTPSLSIPSSVQFSALVGTSDLRTAWIKNVGNGTLSISHYGLKHGWPWLISDSTAHSVLAGDSVAIKLNFEPTASVTYTDSLLIYSNDATNPLAAIKLMGAGTAAKIKMDSQVVFAPQKIGSTSTIGSYIYNQGNGPMTITNISVASASNAFRSTSTIAFPLTLGKGGGRLIDTFAFTAMKVGFDTAIVTISMSGTETGHDTTMLLIGEGISNALVKAGADDASLVVSPNPSHGILNIESRENLEGASVEVIDAVGRAVAVSQIRDNSLDVSSLANGTYFLRIQAREGTVQLRRVVIEH